jgi:hypothetical protein
VEVEDRLADRVLSSPGDGCSGWGGKRNAEGYPVLLVEGVFRRADELAWELAFEPVVPGMYLIHQCGNRECVRVEHLNLAEEPERLPRPPRRRPDMAGAANPRARLTGAQAEELRRRYAAGEGTQEALGREFGITKSAVCRIVAGQRYRASGG